MSLLLVTLSQSQTFNVAVDDAGEDIPECINGTSPCHTLNYVLFALSNASGFGALGTATVNVDVSSAQLISPTRYDFNSPLTLTVSGSTPGGAPPSLTCLTRERLVLSSPQAAPVSVYWYNVRFVNCAGPDSYGLSLLSFARCEAVNYGGALIADTTVVEILSSAYSFGSIAAGAESFVRVSHREMAHVHITDTTFTTANPKSIESQLGTALSVVNCTVHVDGQVTFVNNTGRLGGAVRLTRSQVRVANENATVLFFGNFAQFGSAVFIEETICPILSVSEGHVSLIFQKNTVSGTGQSQVYIDGPQPPSTECLPDPSTYNVTFDDSRHQVSTSAARLAVKLPPGFTVVPGKRISLSVNISDYFRAPVPCEATVYLVQSVGGVLVRSPCNDPRNGIELVCPLATPLHPSSEVLITSDVFNSTLSLKSPALQLHNSTNVTINFACSANATTTVSFEVSDCPAFTMYYSNATRSCECKTPRLQQDQFLCSVPAGAACIRRGYWLENATSPLVAPCGFPFCKGYSSSSSSCPLTPDSDFVWLGDNPDDQCYGNRGGLLCGGCGTGYHPSYPPIRCVVTCSVGHSVGLVFIAIAIQIVKAVLIYALFNIKLGNSNNREGEEANAAEAQPLDFTYFFGSLFCLSVLGRLPFQYLGQYEGLKIYISVYRSLLLPALDVVGDIPWCLFPSIGTLGVFSFNYLAPLLAYTIFAIFYAVKRLCTRKESSPQSSGLRSLSLLVVLSFWSLSYTSIGILKGTQVDGLPGVRVELQPELTYFTHGHIPLAIVSIIILFLLLSFTILLILLPLLYCDRMKKLHDITRPLVEHFHFCFKKGTTWYGATYFTVWMVMAAVSEYHEYLVAFEIILSIFCVFHYVLQPFKSLAANRIDMSILLVLLVLTSLLRHQSLLRAEDIVITVIVHILVVALLVYMTFGLLLFVASQCNCTSYAKIKYSKFKETRHSRSWKVKNADEDQDGYNIFEGPKDTALNNDLTGIAQIQ